MPGQFQEFLGQISIWALPLLLAITLHEAGHAFAAARLGDPTAKLQGRLSLNPLRHIDPFGTIILPLILLFLGGFFFGYAKPVPIDQRYFKKPKRDMMLVAAAGPFANVILAFAAALLLPVALHLSGTAKAFVLANLATALQFNCVLFVLNMLPLPPLDGGRIVTGLLPRPYDARFASIEHYGMLILLSLIFLLPMLGSIFGIRIDFFDPLVLAPAHALVNAFLGMVA